MVMKKQFSKTMLGLGALSMAAISANAQMVPLFEEDPQFIASSATDATPGQWDTDMFRGNAMWVDVNNDGQMDLFLVGNTTAAGWHSHLYGWTNNNGTFTEIQNLPFTQRSDGNACPAGDTRGTNNVTLAWIDYNNDGNIDVIQRGVKENAAGGESSTASEDLFINLYKGNGDGTFTLVENSGLQVIGTEQECLYSGITTVVDFNRDGYQDIAMTGITDGNRFVSLYKNNGDGTFSLLDPETTYVDWMGSAYDLALSSGSIAWGDFNNDGYPDFAVNGWSDTVGGVATIICKNNGDGTFLCLDMAAYDQSYAYLPQQPGTQKGMLMWGDFNNDGWLDLFVCGETYDGTNWGRTADILLNRGNEPEDENIDLVNYPESQFQRIPAGESGISVGQVKGNATDIVDLDGNGYMDIIVCGEGAGAMTDFIMNNGDMTFSEDNFTNKADFRSGTAMEVWDYDGDGYLDFFGMGYRDNGHKFALYHNTGKYEDADFNQHDYPTNNAPEGPSSVEMAADGNGVMITWGNGNDDVTPREHLRYNVVIEKNNGEIVSLVPADIETGALKVAMLQNLVYGNSYKVNIPVADIKQAYVQSVDGSKQTSAFIPVGGQGAGVEEIAANDGIGVWANGDVLNVNVDGAATVAIYGVAGNRVATMNIDGATTIDCTDYSGLYLVKVETEAACKTTKVVF